MKKNTILATAMASVLLSSAVMAEEFRIVATEKFGSESALQVEGLISTESKGSKLKVLTVNANSAQEALEAVRASGLYENVEQDVIVTSIQTPTPMRYSASPYSAMKVRGQSTGNMPTDPEFSEQWYWLEATDENKGQNNVLAAYQSSVYNVKPRVGIIDSGFYENDDIVYSSDSYSFTTAFSEVRGTNFYGSDDQELCQFAHGTSIAAIIGGIQNNDVGIAGVADAEIVAARAMKCGTGTLSDVADAMYYMSGKTDVADAPVISEKVDVINLSLGGPAATCPQYIQDAIDYAVGQNIVVMVTANNDHGETKDFTPSNCNNIVVVGAVDRAGEKAAFSNTGPEVDLVAAGMDVVAPGPYGDMYWWEGTSQALPIATGMVALAKAEYPSITPTEVETLMKATTSDYSSTPTSAENSCDNDACGTGVLNGGEFISKVRDYMGGDVSFIKHALGGQDACTEQLYTDYFGNSLGLCDMFEVTFMAGAERDDNVKYELYQVPVSQQFSLANATKVLETNEVSVMNSTIDSDSYNYGFVTCTGGNCGTELLRMNQSAAHKPASCN